MTRHRFYQIPLSAYLFGIQLRTEEVEGSEESVRQWCAFELIRIYGYISRWKIKVRQEQLK